MSTIQIRRTPTPNNPPTGLGEGELAVELAGQPSPRLWVGVNPGIDPSGRRVIADGEGANIPPLTPTQILLGGTAGEIVQDARLTYDPASDILRLSGTSPELNCAGQITSGRYFIGAAPFGATSGGAFGYIQLGAVTVQWGRYEWLGAFVADTGYEQPVGFPIAFGGDPYSVMVIGDWSDNAVGNQWWVHAFTATTFNLVIFAGATRNSNSVYWIAVGPTPPVRRPRRQNHNGRRKGRVHGS